MSSRSDRHERYVLRQSALGSIFISHSSVDKPWVRRFEKRLRTEGFGTWLDEKEIDIGDALASKVSEGLREAKVVVVIVSAASLASKWLRYELDIATERMIAGHCRVLPVLIDDVEVPPELSGRRYADMRPGRRGFADVRRTLESEAARYPEPAAEPTMDSEDAWVRKRAYEKFLAGLVGGGWFSASMELSAVREVEFEGFTFQDRDVIVDVVSVYSLREELAERDYEDWAQRVRDDLNETCGLLITEKPPTRGLFERLGIEDRVGCELTKGLFQPSGALVLADLSEGLADSQAREILQRAAGLLQSAIENSTTAPIDPTSLALDK